MDNESTSLLMDVLRHTGREDLDKYAAEHLDACCTDFPSYMDSLIARCGLKRQDIFQRADLPQKYGYKLLSGESHCSDRDKLLRIFIAMGLSLKETQRALTLYGMPVLYPKVRRDAVIIIALNRAVNSVDTVNDWLREQHLPELSRCRD